MAAGVTLWPRFANAREHKTATLPNIVSASITTVYLAVLLALGIVLGAYVALPIAIPNQGVGALGFLFAILCLVQGLTMPASMFLTTPRELRFQALCVALMTATNLALSLKFADRG